MELSQVNDIRPMQLPNDQKLSAQLTKKHGDNILEKSLSICSGLDMVNVSLCNVICQDKKTADVWKAGLRKITNNVKMNNACPKTNLQKHWTRLLLTTTVDGKVSVKCIAKTFASGKTEKMVYQTLAELNLPSEKVTQVLKNEQKFNSLFRMHQFQLTNSPLKNFTAFIRQFARGPTLTLYSLPCINILK